MPYIKEEDREYFKDSLVSLAVNLNSKGNKKGNLNYCITKLVYGHLISQGLSYDTLSDITGVLNDVKTEFERQVVSKYEDEKIEENGSVYDLDKVKRK